MAVELLDTGVATQQKHRITHTGPGGCETAAAAAPRLRPLADRVLIKILPDEEEKVGSFYVPDVAKEKPCRGEVLAVGNGRFVNNQRVPVDVRVGQVILYGRYSGNEVRIGDEKLLLLQENELQGVFEE